MSEAERGQLTGDAAQVYDELFVPALFRQWAPRVADATEIRPGQRVLDVACGTGVLTCEAANRVGASGAVAGLDLNDGMLAVARRTAPAIEWRQGQAEALPYVSGEFDAVVSQFGLMFFGDRRAALREMARVLRPGGRLAVAVWASLDRQAGYAALVGLVGRLFGDEAAVALSAPFCLGNALALQALFVEAGIPSAEIMTLTGTARFPSLETWIFTEIRGWTLADAVDDAQLDLLMREAKDSLRSFVVHDGSVAFEVCAHIVTATCP